jgi:hypothetical protein
LLRGERSASENTTKSEAFVQAAERKFECFNL